MTKSEFENLMYYKQDSTVEILIDDEPTTCWVVKHFLKEDEFEFYGKSEFRYVKFTIPYSSHRCSPLSIK